MPTKKTTAKTKVKTTSKKVAPKKKIVKTSSVKKVVPKKVMHKKVSAKSRALAATKTTAHAEKTGHKKESGLKRGVYMALSILLGLLLGTFVSLFMELVYMHEAARANIQLTTHYFLGMASYLPNFAQPLFLFCGLVFGIWLGFWGWNMVYVQRRHRMFRKA